MSNELTYAQAAKRLKELQYAKAQMGQLSINDEIHKKALEIVLPMLEQQEWGVWMEWKGGECPTPLCEVIDVRWRAGGTMTVIAGEHIWTHDGTFDDIIAYRIIPELATNQNGEQ